MVRNYLNSRAARVRWSLGVLLSWGALVPAQAQESCMLVPVPVSERMAKSTWVVEAQVKTPDVVRDAQGHLLTRYVLAVYKVFKEPGGAALPARLLLPGGRLGDEVEAVSNSPQLAAGQQGVFFLEADPLHAGEWRLFAGPQGLIRYDLPTHTASEPFAAYPGIETAVYPALQGPAKASAYRTVQANTALATAPLQKAAATQVITGLSPASVSAGTGTVLTIMGSGFGATQGTGSVQFLNADNGGTSRVRPLASDYVSWSDTEIKVKVPTESQEGSPAGSGTVTVVNNAGASTTSPTALTVTYSVANVATSGASSAGLRVKLTNANGSGGYTLTFAPSFQLGTAANLAARAAFERSVTQWACATGANRTTTVTASTAVPGGSATDGVNTVTFDAATATLPTGVLGITYSYYRLCGTEVTVPETDFVFANRTDWNFGDHPLAFSEYDFESVALHELGHGIQLGHVINSGAVMHYSIANGQSKRTLGTTDDKAGGNDEVTFSTTANSSACGTAPGLHVRLALAACTTNPLPVELTAFEARYATGHGTTLTWATATEKNSAYFAVEAQEAGTTAWTEVLRCAAAGTSIGPRQYQALDPRLFSGTRYYRLRQVDADGSTSYSPLVTVKGTETELTFYPNPAVDQLHVNSPALTRLTLFDALGRQAATYDVPTGGADVDVSNLRPGVYIVEWTLGQTRHRSRLQKQ